MKIWQIILLVFFFTVVASITILWMNYDDDINDDWDGPIGISAIKI